MIDIKKANKLLLEGRKHKAKEEVRKDKEHNKRIKKIVKDTRNNIDIYIKNAIFSGGSEVCLSCLDNIPHYICYKDLIPILTTLQDKGFTLRIQIHLPPYPSSKKMKDHTLNEFIKYCEEIMNDYLDSNMNIWVSGWEMQT